MAGATDVVEGGDVGFLGVIARPRSAAGGIEGFRYEVVGCGFTTSDSAATALRACAKASGNFLSRLSARRSIPAHAFGLKEYRDRWSPVVSRISDNEQTLPALRHGARVCVHSDILSVQDAPACRIPAPFQGVEKCPEITVLVTFPSLLDFLIVRRTGPGRMYARDILPNDPAGAESASKEAKLDGQIATCVIQARAPAGDGEALAGGASNEKVNWSDISGLDLSEVA